MSVQLDHVKQKARRVFQITLWSLLIAALIFATGYYIYRNYTISEGTRTGILYKVSKKGVMFKTYEGQLLLAGSVMLTQQSTWDFSAQNGKVYEDLQRLEGKSIKCHYRQKVDAFSWQGDTDYIVYKVELAQ